METSSTSMIVEYAKSTQNVCLCLSISAFLIMLFIMSPLNSFVLSSLFGKIIILILLGYTIFYNVTKTNKFASNFNIDIFSGDWDPVKMNIICSYIFTGFLSILMLTVFQKLFR
jgi:hypothetical protein